MSCADGFRLARSFTIAGASGGYQQPDSPGGLSAVVTSTITLAAGSAVYLVVGQLPADPTVPAPYHFGGGGGATYVFLGNLETPLLVAGSLTCSCTLPTCNGHR